MAVGSLRARAGDSGFGRNSVAPPVDVNGTEYRARLLDLAAYPRSVLLATVAAAERAADAIVHARDIIFGGYPAGRPH